MTNEFKKHAIERSCNIEYRDYHRYRKCLEVDFKNRCAYCNMHDRWIMPLPFQIDHFIPRAEFEKVGRNDLENDYRNLMYSCPVCNRLKSNAFEGEIPDHEIKNPLFYNPVDVDYNTVFTRDEKGRIQSADELGKSMIKRLQLYRPTKQMAWFLDELKQVYDEIEKREKAETDTEKKAKLELAHMKIGNALFRRHQFFVHSFMAEKAVKNKKI